MVHGLCLDVIEWVWSRSRDRNAARSQGQSELCAMDDVEI